MYIRLYLCVSDWTQIVANWGSLITINCFFVAVRKVFLSCQIVSFPNLQEVNFRANCSAFLTFHANTIFHAMWYLYFYLVSGRFHQATANAPLSIRLICLPFFFCSYTILPPFEKRPPKTIGIVFSFGLSIPHYSYLLNVFFSSALFSHYFSRFNCDFCTCHRLRLVDIYWIAIVSFRLDTKVSVLLSPPNLRFLSQLPLYHSIYGISIVWNREFQEKLHRLKNLLIGAYFLCIQTCFLFYLFSILGWISIVVSWAIKINKKNLLISECQNLFLTSSIITFPHASRFYG